MPLGPPTDAAGARRVRDDVGGDMVPQMGGVVRMRNLLGWRRLRPVRLLGVWISEGLTQADS